MSRGKNLNCPKNSGVAGAPGTYSPWVTFRVLPTGEGRPPGRLVRLWAGAVFVWQETRLLLGGIRTGIGQLLRKVGGVPPVDVISTALILAILAGIGWPYIERLGPGRAWRWGGVLAYTAFIYATLPVVPRAWRALWGYTQGRIDNIGTTVTVAAGIALMVYMGITCRRLVSFALVPPLVGAYAWLLMHLGRSPAERLHLAEYGLLSLLTFSALRIDIPTRSAYFGGWAIAAGIGIVDEVIQWFLPDRVFEWKDIGLNVLSSGLGMAVIAMIGARSRGPDR